MAVCFFHFTCGNPTYLPAEHPLRLLGAWGRYGVDMFFVVSGFVIPYSLARRGYRRQDLPAFLRRRFWRIEVPYLASVVLALGVGYAVARYKGAFFAVSWGQLLAHLAYLNNLLGYDWLVPVYWTLAIEFQYYIWIGLIFEGLFSEKIAVRWFFWAIWGTLAYLMPKDIWLFEYGGLFGLGIFLCQYSLKRIEKIEFAAGVALCLACLVGKMGIASACAGLLAFGVIAGEALTGKSPYMPALVRWTGEISYSLYLTHVLIGGKLIGIVEQKFTSLPVRIAAIGVAIALAWAFASVFYLLIEKPSRPAEKFLDFSDKKLS